MASRSLRILAVDDEEALLQLLKLFLTRQQHEVTTFHHPRQALEWFRVHGHEVDLAIVDLTMPEIAGEDLAKDILAENLSVKVLLSSGYPYDIENLPEEYRERVGFLGKPFVPRELQAAIEGLFP